MISIRSLSKNYGSNRALSELTLEVPKGEMFGFLGPNGAGKTTTVKILAGVVRPTAGTAVVGGYDILAEPIRAKRVTGYIPDHPFLYEKLTGIEFLRFIADLYRLEAPWAANARSLLETFDLWERSGELIEGYSHGMKQKLTIASALLIDPDVLVVDEPMVGLDPKSARIVKGMFKDLCARGKTIFMSTHSLDVASQLCDRIGIIQCGRLRALGTLAELDRFAGTTDSDLEEIFLTITDEIPA